MNKITFPLKLQMKRPEVAHLHEALAFLSCTIAESETTKQRYGASTRAAVKQFQTAQKMPETGTVDEATANVINDLLAGDIRGQTLRHPLENGALQDDLWVVASL